jgi:hypothetical protein
MSFSDFLKEAIFMINGSKISSTVTIKSSIPFSFAFSRASFIS